MSPRKREKFISYFGNIGSDNDNYLQVDEFLSRGQMLVVVDGTGRMADILSYAYREAQTLAAERKYFIQIGLYLSLRA